MRFTADARLAIGTLADVSRRARPPARRLRRHARHAATCASGDVAATLAAPATVTVAGGAVELTPLALDSAPAG